MNIAANFEKEKKLKPTQAAKILGFSYSLWKKLKSGEKLFQQYHKASIEAHLSVNDKTFDQFKTDRLEK